MPKFESDINIDKIKFIKQLGKGLYGTTYKILYNNRYYALKRQKILKSYILGGTKFTMWREFKFFSWINKLSKYDQNFFMKLYAYKFYSDCDFSNDTENHPNKLVQKLNKSKHCLDMMFDLKQGVVYNVIDNLNFKQSVSLCVQGLYIIHLLSKSSFIHNDLHLNNMAYVETNKNHQIKMDVGLNKIIKFKSYGYQFSLIDYGLILHKNFKLKQKEQKKYDQYIKFNRDFSMFFIYYLTQTKYGIGKVKSKLGAKSVFNPKYVIFKELYSRPYLYQRIKKLIISSYPDMTKYYKIYESSGKISRFLLYEVVQFMAIYDKKLLAEICHQKYEPNFLPDHILEYIKLNVNNLPQVIEHLVMRYLD
jgi:hypothetical protein